VYGRGRRNIFSYSLLKNNGARSFIGKIKLEGLSFFLKEDWTLKQITKNNLPAIVLFP